MSKIIEVNGMIIKSKVVAEYDRLITILTLEKGKIYVFVNGARKQGSSFMGISREFLYGKFKIYENRNSYNLQSAVIVNYFEEITKDMESTCYGAYFLELTDYYTREYVIDVPTLKLLYCALLAILKPSLENKLVRRIFELRMMSENGDYENLENEKMNESTIFAINYVLTTPVEKLFTFSLKREINDEFSEVVDKLLRDRVTKQINSLEILNIVCT